MLYKLNFILKNGVILTEDSLTDAEVEKILENFVTLSKGIDDRGIKRWFGTGNLMVEFDDLSAIARIEEKK